LKLNAYASIRAGLSSTQRRIFRLLSLLPRSERRGALRPVGAGGNPVDIPEHRVEMARAAEPGIQGYRQDLVGGCREPIGGVPRPGLIDNL
jgi:hypothetical protein